MNHSKLNLFVVDDDEAVRSSLGMLLLSRGHAVQTFASGEAFLACGKLQGYGCVVLDLRMGAGMTGLQVFNSLRACASPLLVLFLSGHGDISTAVDAVQNGAFGWLEKSCGHERLLEKLNEALMRASQLSNLGADRDKAQQRWDTLTPREREVARLVAQGHANKEVARRMEPPCELRTVEAHRAKVYAKLGLSKPPEIDRFVREHGL
jgi:FixJ family two-component response regulator